MESFQILNTRNIFLSPATAVKPGCQELPQVYSPLIFPVITETEEETVEPIDAEQSKQLKKVSLHPAQEDAEALAKELD